MCNIKTQFKVVDWVGADCDFWRNPREKFRDIDDPCFTLIRGCFDDGSRESIEKSFFGTTL